MSLNLPAVAQPQPVVPRTRYEGLAHPQLALTSVRFTRARLVWGFLAFTVAYAGSLLFLDVMAYTWAEVSGQQELPDGTPTLGPLGDTARTLLTLALAIPVLGLVLRWVEGRPLGTVLSVTGRLRWKWQLICFALAVPLGALLLVLMLNLVGSGESAGAAEKMQMAGWDFFLPALAVLLLLVPLQVAAEEIVFRGWLAQLVGALTRHPWIAIAVQAPLFGLAHGWGTSSGFLTLTYFGVAAGWLTYRTGGVEAAIGLHLATNLLSFVLGAAVKGGLASDETAADAPLSVAAADMTVTTVYALVVLWLARRWGVQRTRSVQDFRAAPDVWR